MKKAQASKTTKVSITKKGAPTPGTNRKSKPAAKSSAVDDLVTQAPVAADVIPAPERALEPPASVEAPAAAEPARTKRNPETREGSKKAMVLALLTRDGGASLGEIAQATDWQLHSIRGFLSTLGKKMGVKVASTRGEGDAKRRYHVA